MSEEARTVKTAERKKLAGQGKALPGGTGGGSFPIKTVADLKNAIKAYGRAKNKAAAKALIIRRAKALKSTGLLPKGWLGAGDSAGEGYIACPEDECARAFIHEDRLFEHADRVHNELDVEALVDVRDFSTIEKTLEKASSDGTLTFNDIEELVREAVREKYYEPSDYRASPVVPGVYAWVRDLSASWVVFTVEEGGDETLYQSSYSILDGKVTLGERVAVTRKTVYEPIKED